MRGADSETSVATNGVSAEYKIMVVSLLAKISGIALVLHIYLVDCFARFILHTPKSSHRCTVRAWVLVAISVSS